MKKKLTTGIMCMALMSALALCACTPAVNAPAVSAPAASAPATSAPATSAPEAGAPEATSAAPADAATADTSLSDVLASGKLVLGMDDQFPPMGFRDENNEITGFDVEVATEVAKRMGLELVPAPIDWAAKMTELDTGNVDVLWNGFTITESRLENTEMTCAYMKNRQVIVVMADSEVASLADLSGKTLSLQADSSAEEALSNSADFKASLADVVLLSTNVDALRDLEVKGCDAVLMDEIVANYYITQGSKYKVLSESLADEEYGIGCKKGNVALRDEIQKQLEAMASDGTLETISQKWFGLDATTVGK